MLSAALIPMSRRDNLKNTFSKTARQFTHPPLGENFKSITGVWLAMTISGSWRLLATRQ